MEPPWIGDALERVFASVYELKAGAGHEIADRARDKNLAWAGFSGDAGGDVDSELQDRQHPNPVSQITELQEIQGASSRGWLLQLFPVSVALATIRLAIRPRIGCTPRMPSWR